jgi:hypothetical protein
MNTMDFHQIVVVYFLISVIAHYLLILINIYLKINKYEQSPCAHKYFQKDHYYM